MVHHRRRRGRIVAMGVSAEALSPKCDTSERAKLRTVLIMIVNNNRARHRRLPDVTRALYRLGTYTTIGATPTVRSTGERLSINHKHAHAHNRLLIRVAHSYSLLFASDDPVPAGGPVDLTGRISLTRRRQRERTCERANSREYTHVARRAIPRALSRIVTVIRRYLGCSFNGHSVHSGLIYNAYTPEVSLMIDNISGSRR